MPMSLAEVIGAAEKPKPLVRRPDVLLSSNTVKPMHGVVPRIIKGREWWDETRQAAYRASGFRCVACGVSKYDAKKHKWLEGHEVYHTDYGKGRMLYVETVALCHYCHNFIHNGRLESLLGKGLVQKAEYEAIMAHGTAVLKAVGLKKRPPKTFKIAKWENWRLILDGKEYPPMYRNYNHWLNAFWETDEACKEDPW